MFNKYIWWFILACVVVAGVIVIYAVRTQVHNPVLQQLPNAGVQPVSGPATSTYQSPSTTPGFQYK